MPVVSVKGKPPVGGQEVQMDGEEAFRLLGVILLSLLALAGVVAAAMFLLWKMSGRV